MTLDAEGETNKLYTYTGSLVVSGVGRVTLSLQALPSSSSAGMCVYLVDPATEVGAIF